MALKQSSRLLKLHSPLGDDKLLLISFEGKERMSRLFSFELEMISDDNQIDAQQIVGKNVTFSVDLRDGSPRYFNGFVNQFLAKDEDEEGRRNYSAEVVPWLWFLTQTTDCRVFQNKKVPDIIQQIFQDLGFSDFELKLQGNHKQREYCVQYGETDFDFVSRLMEQEGIFYFFRHESGKHTMVIADSKSAYYDCKENEVDYPRSGAEVPDKDHITGWEHRYEFRPGKFAQTDYNFETPTTSLMTNVPSVVKMTGMDKFELYEYPGDYLQKSDGQSESKIHIEEEEAAHDVVLGTSGCKSFTVGGKFKIKRHRSASEIGKSFVLTTVQHTATEALAYETGGVPEMSYNNSFTCIPDSVVFRPRRRTPRTFVHGVQTAVVVGPSGEEIYTDKYARVKVQFHWDREGKRDENSSCWVRVSNVHSGKGFGGIDIPRIGEEVVVDFLEGDPDRPIITGRVYNAQNMPPFGLPGGKTRSGMKTKTYKGGGYNEITLDDSTGKEQIRIHAQYNMDTRIENDETHSVGKNREADVGVNETMSVGNNQSLSVGANKSVQVGSNHVETVGANQAVTVAVNQATTVGVNQINTIGASQTNVIGTAKSETVGDISSESVGNAKTTTVGKAYAITTGKTMETSVGVSSQEDVGKTKMISVGSKLAISVGDELAIVCGDSMLIMKKNGDISLVGNDISIKGSGKINIKAGGDMALKGSTIAEN